MGMESLGLHWRGDPGGEEAETTHRRLQIMGGAQVVELLGIVMHLTDEKVMVRTRKVVQGPVELGNVSCASLCVGVFNPLPFRARS